MSTGTIFQHDVNDLSGTIDLGVKIGQQLQGGELISLTSDLGGGKTSFVRGLAAGIGSKDHVASPTFTLSREYNSANRRLTLKHFDLYRLAEPGLIQYELADFINDPEFIIVIEWAAIVEKVLPDIQMHINIKRTGELSRRFTISNPYDTIRL